MLGRLELLNVPGAQHRSRDVDTNREDEEYPETYGQQEILDESPLVQQETSPRDTPDADAHPALLLVREDETIDPDVANATRILNINYLMLRRADCLSFESAGELVLVSSTSARKVLLSLPTNELRVRFDSLRKDHVLITYGSSRPRSMIQLIVQGEFIAQELFNFLDTGCPEGNNEVPEDDGTDALEAQDDEHRQVLLPKREVRRRLHIHFLKHTPTHAHDPQFNTLKDIEELALTLRNTVQELQE